MAETNWSEEVVEAPKKKGIPIWVWGCGGGCLLMIIAGLVLGVFLFREAKGMADPEMVWPEIAEVLPFDERPEGYRVLKIPFTQMFGLLNEEHQLAGMLISTGEAGDQEELDKFFAGEVSGSGILGMGEIQDSESLTMKVQGRECRALRFRSSDVQMPFGMAGDAEEQMSIMLVDLSDGSGEFVLLELFDLSGGETGQEDVDTFFEPFDPWR